MDVTSRGSERLEMYHSFCLFCFHGHKKLGRMAVLLDLIPPRYQAHLSAAKPAPWVHIRQITQLFWVSVSSSVS